LASKERESCAAKKLKVCEETLTAHLSHEERLVGKIEMGSEAA